MNKITKKTLPVINRIAGKLASNKFLAALRDIFMTLTPISIIGGISILVSTLIFGGKGSEDASILGWLWMASNGSTDVIFSGAWKEISDFGVRVADSVSTATLSSLGLLATIATPYIVAKQLNAAERSIHAIVVSTGSFLLFTHLDMTYFGIQGLLLGVVGSYLISYLFLSLTNLKSLKIYMPPGVPPAVAKSFEVLFPFMITLTLAGTIDAIFYFLANSNSWNLHSTGSILFNIQQDGKVFLVKSVTDQVQITDPTVIAALQNQDLGNDILIKELAESGIITDKFLAAGVSVTRADLNGLVQAKIVYTQITNEGNNFHMGVVFYKLLQSPLTSLTNSNGGFAIVFIDAIILGMLPNLVGIHGGGLSSITTPILSVALLSNMSIYQSMSANNYPIAEIQNSLTAYTVAARDVFAMISLGGTMAVAFIIFSKNPAKIMTARTGVLPGVFNITEPIWFGLPIVLKGRYILPWVIVPAINLSLGLVITNLGWLNKPVIAVPWTLPHPLMGIITLKDIRVLIYFPIFLAFQFAASWVMVILDHKEVKKNGGKLYSRKEMKQYFRELKQSQETNN